MFDFLKAFIPTSASVPVANVNVPIMQELGVSGVKISNGYVYEEFLMELSGERGRRMYREMSDNDPTIGALISAFDMVIRAAEWRVEPNEKDHTNEGADFLESIMDDMERPWPEFISEVLTEIVFGFSIFEKVYKRRVGMYEKDPSRKSKHDDGLIGIRKLSIRAQETVERWETSPNGDILGVHQQPPQGGGLLYIPSEKLLHFRTTTKKNNPEGRSILRNSYTSYYFKKNIQWVEATAIERELAGLPVVRVPSDILTDPEKASVLLAYQKMARDLKFNEQGAILIPSDLWKDDNGKPIPQASKVDIHLMSASGSRAIDTTGVITRYDKSIVRSAMADFLMLGSETMGSFALSKSKTQLFLVGCKSIIDNIAAVLNSDLVPELWALNGMPEETMPKFSPGSVAPPDLAELGKYISDLSTAGLAFAGDPETEKALRQAAGLPEEVVEPLIPDISQPFDPVNPNYKQPPGQPNKAKAQGKLQDGQAKRS